MITTATQSGCFRPLDLNGKELGKIYFFRNGEILYSVSRGWLELNSQDTIEFSIGSVKNCRTADLNKKESFMIKEDGKNALYIYADGETIDVSAPIEVKATESKTETNYKLSYGIKIPHRVYNAKFDDTGRVVYTPSEVITEVRTAYSQYYTRAVKTEFGEKVDYTAEILKGYRITISRYDLENLLKEFDLVKK